MQKINEYQIKTQLNSNTEIPAETNVFRNMLTFFAIDEQFVQTRKLEIYSNENN